MEERKPKTVIVPEEIDTGNLHYPVDRGIKHVTLLVTVSGGGDACFPLAVTKEPELEKIVQMGIRVTQICPCMLEIQIMWTKRLFVTI